MMWLQFFLTCLSAVYASQHHHHNATSGRSKPLPIVLWHGMGDSCCNPLSLGAIKKHLEDKIPGVYVHSLSFGDGFASDTRRGFFANMNEMVALACIHIMKDPALKDGYNAIGFSQGGLFLRALAQRCALPRMANLVSIGGPQQGVFGLPYCIGDTRICNSIRWLLELGAYDKPIQHRIVQAQYWHDSNDEETYRAKSIFLADINNENTINKNYVSNLLRLKNMILIKFEDDHMVVPKETSWFGFYANNDESTILTYNETRLYKEDRLGLRQLEQSGRLHLLSWPGEHLRINLNTFDEQIVQKFFV